MSGTPVRGVSPLPARGRIGTTYASPGPRGVNVSLILPMRIFGREAFGYPVLEADGIIVGTPPWRQGLTYMPYPDGQGDIFWQGGYFGIPSAGGTAQVNEIAITVTQRVSDPAAFSFVTAQILDGATPVGSPVNLTLSATYVTETFMITSGYPAADLPNLTVQLRFHQQTSGLAFVNHVYAAAGISYADSIGPNSPYGTTSMPFPAITVTPGVAKLVSQGPASSSLSPSFGQPTTAGNLLIAWTFSNPFGPFDVTTSSTGWLLAGHTGAQGGWESLWYKPDCRVSEPAPVFNGGGSTLASGLMEFSGARYLDQAGGTFGAEPLVLSSGHIDTASGDLVVAFGIWGTSSAGPVTMTMTGTDSSGAVLPLHIANNASSTNVGLYWMTGWAQASIAAGPGSDMTSSTFSAYIGGGGGIVASFKALPPAIPPLYISPGMMNKVVVIPVRIG